MTAAETTALKLLSDHFMLFVKENRATHDEIKLMFHETRDELKADVLYKFESVVDRVAKIELNCEERRIAGAEAIAAAEVRAVTVATAPTEGHSAIRWFGQVGFRFATILAVVLGVILSLFAILGTLHVL